MKIYKAVTPEVGDKVIVSSDRGFRGEGVITDVPRETGHRYGVRIGKREEYILSNHFHVKGYKGYDNYS